MKNSLKLLSVVLLLTVGAWCQVSGTISATSTDCSVANSCLTMNLPTSQSTGYSGLMVSVTPSSFSGTLTFEVSDGTTWTIRQGYASTDNSSGVTTSAAGSNLSYQFNVSGWLGFRVRGSSYSSGSVVVKINPSPGSASSGHGGGSGGAVSSVTGAGTVSCSPTTGSVVCTGSGGGASAGTTNDVQIAGAGGTFAAVTGEFTYINHVLDIGNGLAIGATPPTACGTATGCIAFNEAAGAGTPILGQDYMRADSTTHSLRCSFNNGAEAACNSGGTIYRYVDYEPICQGQSPNSAALPFNYRSATTGNVGPAPFAICVQPGGSNTSNTVLAAAQFTATGQTINDTFVLTDEWTAFTKLELRFGNEATTPTGNIVWDFYYACIASTGASVDPTLSSVQTLTVAAQASFTTNIVSITPTIVGCSAGQRFYWKIAMDASSQGVGAGTAGNTDLTYVRFKLQ